MAIFLSSATKSRDIDPTIFTITKSKHCIISINLTIQSTHETSTISMVPFGILLGNDNGVGLQFSEPQYYENSPLFSPEKSRLDVLDLSTIPRDLYLQEDDEYFAAPCSLSIDRSSYLSLEACELGESSSHPMSVPLNSLSAEEISDESSKSLTIGSRVSFKKQVECFEIDTLDSYSDQEYDAMWYTPEETQAMRMDCVRTVQVMVGDLPLQNNDCFRGLECKTGLPLQARQQRKALSRNRVLEEQAFYKDLGEVALGMNAIAEVARQYSAPSVEHAIQIAKRDHSQDCDQWMTHFDEDEWTYSNEIVTRGGWLLAALPIAPKLSYFDFLRNPITV